MNKTTFLSLVLLVVSSYTNRMTASDTGRITRSGSLKKKAHMPCPKEKHVEAHQPLSTKDAAQVLILLSHGPRTHKGSTPTKK